MSIQPIRITPAPSQITKLGFVRIKRSNLISAQTHAVRLGLVIDTVYGTENQQLADVACRRMGSRGNHEPRWTDAERDQFARAGL